jgi:hypothetical protein
MMELACGEFVEIFIGAGTEVQDGAQIFSSKRQNIFFSLF